MSGKRASRTMFVGGERAVCGCRRPVTNIGDRLGSRWVHDAVIDWPHKPFAITAVSR